MKLMVNEQSEDAVVGGDTCHQVVVGLHRQQIARRASQRVDTGDELLTRAMIQEQHADNHEECVPNVKVSLPRDRFADICITSTIDFVWSNKPPDTSQKKAILSEESSPYKTLA